ncbi:MAG: protein-L-isoaspartate(D-aspartate) O-methyltransferase [Candidatus Nanoarchaeia archaeon]
MSVDKLTLLSYWRNSGLITDEAVLNAIEKVPREDFVLKEHRHLAYLDEPLPLKAGQTISQPTTVAIMTQALEVKEGQKVLEIGTGSGYQAAVLSVLVGPKGKIYTIERIAELVNYARKNLKNYKNVTVVHADGTKGYAKAAPFDRIIVTAAAAQLPDILFKQLKEKGIIVIPIEDRLFKIRKIKGKPEMRDLGLFVFVPLLTGVA